MGALIDLFAEGDMWRMRWRRLLWLELWQWVYWLRPWRIKDMWKALNVLASHGGRVAVGRDDASVKLANLMFRRRLLLTEHVGFGFYNVILTKRACWLLRVMSRGKILVEPPDYRSRVIGC